jgi:hypothetical protein
MGLPTNFHIRSVGGMLREPTSEISGKFSTTELSLRTTSPGIILVVLPVRITTTTI